MLLTTNSAWVFFFLPEVKDRSLEEIDEMVSLDVSFSAKRNHEYPLTKPWSSYSSKRAFPPESSDSMSASVELAARQRRRKQRLFMRRKSSGLMEKLLLRLQQLLLEITVKANDYASRLFSLTHWLIVPVYINLKASICSNRSPRLSLFDS